MRSPHASRPLVTTLVLGTIAAGLSAAGTGLIVERGRRREFLTRPRRLTVEAGARAKATGRRTARRSRSRASVRRATRSTRSTRWTWRRATSARVARHAARPPARSSTPRRATSCSHRRITTRRRSSSRTTRSRSAPPAGAPLLLGLRPGNGALREERQDRHAEAPHQHARLRRGGQLLARRSVDRVLVHASGGRSHAVAGRAKQLETDPSFFAEIHIMKADAGDGSERQSG